MRFLSDESCDHSIVRALRTAGHDVLAVSEIAKRADDEDIVSLALKEQRVILTEDRDFGQLVYAGGQPTAGIVYLRVHPRERASIGDRVARIVAGLQDQLLGSFVVVTPGRVRVGRPPPR